MKDRTSKRPQSCQVRGKNCWIFPVSHISESGPKESFINILFHCMNSIAQKGLVILLSLFLVLCVSILPNVVPYKLVWRDSLKSAKEMCRFEIVSILLHTLFVAIVLVHANFCRWLYPEK